MNLLSNTVTVLCIIVFSCKHTTPKRNKIMAPAAPSPESIDSAIVQIIGWYSEPEFDTVACGLNLKPRGKYVDQKSQAQKLKAYWKQVYSDSKEEKRDSVLNEVATSFSHHLLNQIVPFWYGTPWDFEGHTSIPNQGEIACGYFVSTTLSHMGLKLNRYRMAQQSAKSEAMTVLGSGNQKLIYFSDEYARDDTQDLPSGLYLLGLDNHVGFLYNTKDKSYFIHSDYVNGFVSIEESGSSGAFWSSVYCLAPISANSWLMKKWLFDDEVQVVMD